jgi:hypothetical protein
MIPIEEALSLVRQAAAFFGTAAAVVIGLVAFLGGLFAKRVLQNERAAIEAGLLALGHELGLVKVTFEKQRDLLTDYYTTFYRHYRRCQDTATADALRSPDDSITMTKDEFLKELDAFLEDWREQEPRIRLFLPSPLLQVHSDAIDAFNEFKRSVDRFNNTEEGRTRKKEAFAKVHRVKENMEAGLRDFLRTDRFRSDRT